MKRFLYNYGLLTLLFIFFTGMQAQQRNIDTTANNLANVNTTGFKKILVQVSATGFDL